MSNVKLIFLLAVLLNCFCGIAKNVNIIDYNKDGANWDKAYASACTAAGVGGSIIFPANNYKFKNVIEIKNSITLIFQGGCISTDKETLFRIISGENINFLGQGQATLLINENGKTVRKGNQKLIPSIIDLEYVSAQAAPSITVRNLNFKGVTGLCGILRSNKGGLNNLTVRNCKFTCSYAGIAHRHSKVNSLAVKDCHFNGGLFGVRVMSPIPNGARVENNILKNIQVIAIRLSGGRVNQISQGCTRDMMSAIIHGNQILDSANKHQMRSYVCGVLAYGYNVSIQNNIVRNFNRGERISGLSKGNQIRMPDGKINISAWRTEKGKRKRIAGAALYAKGRNVIISNNICSNSGYRAVIEIKTAGLEPYAIVSGNILDGSSLAPHDSYGIECLTSKAIWSNNLFYNMPNTAFALRSLKQNTFINNVIYDSRSAFMIMDSGNQEELIKGNRLVNVKYKFIDVYGKPLVNPPITQTAQATIIVRGSDELPKPSERNQGQMAVVRDRNSDQVFICARRNGKYLWQQVKLELPALQLSWSELPVGKNLIKNPTLKPATGKKFLIDAWKIWVEKVPYGQFFKHEKSALCAGVMNVGKSRGYSWILSQKEMLQPNRKYRLSAYVKVDSDLTCVTLSVNVDKNRHTVINQLNNKWEKLSIDFRAAGLGKTDISFYGRQCGNAKKIWIKDVKLFMLK
jgi:hypothetical protein